MSKTSRMTLAPQDGGVLETMEMFQYKYNKTHKHGGGDHLDGDEERKRGQQINQQVILPSGWGKRLKKPSKVYKYSAQEVLQYNSIRDEFGPHTAKSWADRRFHERYDA